jgi:hypothetical protein
MRPVTVYQPVTTVEVPATLRLTFKGQSSDVFSFEVMNFSDKAMIVDRDAVELVKPTGERVRRLAGGAARSYSLPPGGVQAVRLRYDLGQMQAGDVATIDFGPALLVNGARVAVPPLHVPLEQ